MNTTVEDIEEYWKVIRDTFPSAENSVEALYRILETLYLRGNLAEGTKPERPKLLVSRDEHSRWVLDLTFSVPTRKDALHLNSVDRVYSKAMSLLFAGVVDSFQKDLETRREDIEDLELRLKNMRKEESYVHSLLTSLGEYLYEQPNLPISPNKFQ